MRVKLKDIEPNPHRNFHTNPLSEQRIEELRDSIRLTDWWENIVLRPHPKQPGKYEQAYGHHGLEAAKRESIETADLPVKQLDDIAMLRMMHLENATQRGNSPASIHDSVEGGVREMSYWLLKCETLEEFNSGLVREPGRLPWNRKEDYTQARNAVLKGDGPGREVVGWGIGMKEGTLLKEAIHSLRKSGRTAEILKEVEARVEAELERERIEQAKLEREQAAPAKVEKQRERVAKAERTTATARAAKVKAEAEKPTLDKKALELFEETTAANHFKRWVTNRLSRWVAVKDQMALAKHIIELAKQGNEGRVSREWVELICRSLEKRAEHENRSIEAKEFARKVKSIPALEFAKQYERASLDINRLESSLAKLLSTYRRNPTFTVPLEEITKQEEGISNINQTWRELTKAIQ